MDLAGEELSSELQPLFSNKNRTSSSGVYLTSAIGLTSFKETANFNFGETDPMIATVKDRPLPLSSTANPCLGIGIGYLWYLNKAIITLGYEFYLETLKAETLDYPIVENVDDTTNHAFSKSSSHNLFITLGYYFFEALIPYIGVGITRGSFAYSYKHEFLLTKVKKSLWGKIFIGGIRFSLTEHLHLKLEYQHQQFSKFFTGELEKISAPAIIGTTVIKPNFSTILIGLNYKF